MPGHPKEPPKASVLLLTKEAGPGFAGLLEGLFAQETGFPYEVVVVDSGSADGTPEMAARRGARVHRIEPSSFDHGATRDLGVSLSRGGYVAMLVQDALPADGRWLAEMVGTLESDPPVAGVYGRQIPHPDAGLLARALVNGMPTASTRRREQHAGDPETYRALPPARKRSLAMFDDVSSCIRRSVWEEIPFGKAAFGEDLRWGKRAVEAGHKLVYEPRSAVYHSHERGPLYDLRRAYVDSKLLAELFGIRPGLLRLPPTILLSAASLFRRMRKEPGGGDVAAPRVAWEALRHASVSGIGASFGARSDRLPARLDRLLGGGV